MVPTFTEDVGDDGKLVVVSVAATGTKITLDFPPPGEGLATCTEPRPTAATNPLGTVAVSFVELKKVVVSVVPFQTTVDVDTNPVPLTVSTTPVDPGLMLTGETISINGTGLLAAQRFAAKTALSASTEIAPETRRFKKFAIDFWCRGRRDDNMAGRSSWVM
jgi:hypothetical protein